MNGEYHLQKESRFRTYIAVFVALFIFTAVSFVAYEILGQGLSSLWIILMMAMVKAALVALFFMHLKYDWGRLYFLILPLLVLDIMMIIVLLPDGVLGWHNYGY